ncbi:hypothetical protein PanWU01x14_309530, partial [Parasponia andersonii]
MGYWWFRLLGSKVERVKRRRVMKTRRAQIEMVDWALVRRRFELVRLITELGIVVVEVVGLVVLVVEEFGEEEGEEKSLFLSTMAELSSGKKTRRRPIPQLSLELLALIAAVKPIFDFGFAISISKGFYCMTRLL